MAAALIQGTSPSQSIAYTEDLRTVSGLGWTTGPSFATGMPQMDVLQVATNPTPGIGREYYVTGSHGQVWKFSGGTWAGTWAALTSAGSVRRIFVNPYDSITVYAVTTIGSVAGIYRSDDGGGSWLKDDLLEGAIKNANYPGVWQFGQLPGIDDHSNSERELINDMCFDRTDASLWFAAGEGGVAQTSDGGTTWVQLLDSLELPGHPNGVSFVAPYLFVSVEGRGIIMRRL